MLIFTRLAVYSESPLMSLAFVAFIVITIYILQTIVLGTIYNNYRRHAIVRL